MNSKLLHANKAMRQILNVIEDDQIQKKMDEIIIEGISLIENLRKQEKMMFRQFQFEYHYINSTGETFIVANDMTLLFEGQDKDQAIADLKTQAQDNEEETLNFLEHNERYLEKQRK